MVFFEPIEPKGYQSDCLNDWDHANLIYPDLIASNLPLHAAQPPVEHRLVPAHENGILSIADDISLPHAALLLGAPVGLRVHKLSWLGTQVIIRGENVMGPAPASVLLDVAIRVALNVPQ